MKLRALIFAVALSLLASAAHANDDAAAAVAAAVPIAEGRAAPCLLGIRTILEKLHPKSLTLLNEAEAWAKAKGLPYQILEVGPPERKVQRLFIGIDGRNEELMKEYMAKFHLDSAMGDNVAGQLALEFGYEVPGDYVTGVLRTSPDPKVRSYRWGAPDRYLEREEWWRDWIVKRRTGTDSELPVLGYGHVIALDDKEVANVKYFLEHPEERGPCKSDNCVAWTSGIELGTTKAGATDAERKYLFSELGMSRAMAHFEIGRRLTHAANERHAVEFIFLNGEKGKDVFKDAETLAKHLPPDPKIPYENVIRGLGYDKDSDIMKAISQIPDGSKVFIPIAAGASPEGVTALIQKAGVANRGYDVHMLVNGVSEATLRKGANLADNKFRIHSLFLGGNQRSLHAEGKVQLIPGYLGDFTKLVKDPAMTQFHYDAIIVRVSPPDALGRYSLGPNNDQIMTIIKNRPGIKVIAEVNPNIPFTTGDNFLKDEQITAKFESKAALAGPAVVPFTEVEGKIGENLAKLIPDDATVQVGIGNIFGGLPTGLEKAGRKNLKIWTEMFGDPLKEVMEKGIATEAKTGFAYGSDGLYKWLDHNPKVEFHETEFINNPGKVTEIDNFHAVNTGLQVDLYGEVNATMGPGGQRISSPGGQVEFMSGAARSKGGKSIIAIRSTAKEGKLSTITMDLYPGPHTTPHESVTHVVTEYGVAELKGKSERERALALINVAHPSFREELFKQAVERHLVTEADRHSINWHVAPVGGGH